MYMEYHPVIDGEIKSARTFSIDAFRNLLKELKLIRQPKKKIITMEYPTTIPADLVYLNVEDEILIFKLKGQERNLLFNNDTDFKTGKYGFPNTIFFYKKKALYVYAYSKWNGTDTMLYHIMLPNFSDNGSLCMGNVKRETLTSVPDIITQTINSFFDSYFGHTQNILNSNPLHHWVGNCYMFDNSIKLGKLKNIANETLSPSIAVK